MRGPVPTPASPEAKDRGCICSFGQAALAIPNDCPVHGVSSTFDVLAWIRSLPVVTDNGEADQLREAQPVRLSGSAT